MRHSEERRRLHSQKCKLGGTVQMNVAAKISII